MFLWELSIKNARILKSKVFVCQTVFHLLVAILKAMRDSDNSILLVSDKLSFNYEIIKPYFNNIITYPKSSIDEKWLTFRHKYSHYIFKYKSKVRQLVKEECQYIIDWSCFKDCDLILFNDGTPFVIYLMLYGQVNSVTLVEDGEAIYSNLKHNIAYLVKRLIGYPVLLGNSKYVTNVMVRFPERLPKTVRKKSSRLHFDNMLDTVGNANKQKLFEFFELDNAIVKDANNAVLLITQPLSEDGIVSEEYKLFLYREIIDKYGDGIVYIKPHPRESTDYKSIWKNLKILSNIPPAELFTLTGVSFNKVVTLFSSAIHCIPAKEKIFLGVNYDKRVAQGWKSNVGVKNVVK